MNLYTNITFASMAIYLFLAIYVIFFGYKPSLSRLYSWATICLFAWSFGNFMIYFSHSEIDCWVWYRVTAFGQCFFSSAILNLFLILSDKTNLLKKWWCYALLHIPPAVLLIGFLTGKVIVGRFIIKDDGITSLTLTINFWYFYYVAIHLTYLTLVVFILFGWMSRLKYSSEKSQAIGISLTFGLSLLIAVFITIILPLTSDPDVLFLTPTAAIFGSVGTWYATVKYKLMVLTPSLAAESILNTMVDSVVLVDSEFRILTVNNETCRLLGYEEQELIGKKLDILFVQKDTPAGFNIAGLLKNGPVRNFETRYKMKDGKSIPIVFSASEYRDKGDNLIGIIVIARDITDHKKAEESLMHLAHHDFLTGLPNRLLLTDRLEQALARANRDHSMTAVVMLDLDRFKEVNDVYGHNIGDCLLVEVSDRLKSVISRVDTIARFGGDEFIFIITDLKSSTEVEKIVENMHSAFVEGFIIGSHELNITASIGISIYPYDGTMVDTLVKNADLAMYHAKNEGKNNYQFFTNALGVASSERLMLEKNLRKAIEQNRFVVYYQPIFEVNTGEIVCMEALVRWQHPEEGLVPPSKFIPLAEETGLISQIGEFVLRSACRQNSRWIRQGLSSVPVSVNLSPSQFKQSDLMEKILGILEETGLEPRYLQLEITETTAMSDAEKTSDILQKLYEHGVNFIIDDFGIGYSSLNYLRRFPVHTIKIDSFFIREITSNSNDAAIANAIFAMAQAMNLKVIAEGVETAEQLEFLRSLEWKPVDALKCYGAQGYFFSRPVPPEVLKNMLMKHNKLRSGSIEQKFA